MIALLTVAGERQDAVQYRFILASSSSSSPSSSYIIMLSGGQPQSGKERMGGKVAGWLFQGELILADIFALIIFAGVFHYIFVEIFIW